MYRVERRFTVPFGHRLSKHTGRCKNFHGHNMVILVGLKTKKLDKNDMVMDFSELNSMVNETLDFWDHTLFIHDDDREFVKPLEQFGQRVLIFSHDPTAERLCEVLYDCVIHGLIDRKLTDVEIDYVTIYENENSKATFSEE